MSDVSISVLDHVSPMLRGAVKALKDQKPALRTSGAYMYRAVIEQFRTEGARSGDNWPPLSKATIRGRRKKSRAILQDTGRLRRSVVSRGGDSIYELTDTSLRIGTNVEYARIHQKGGTINRVSRAGSARLRNTRKGSRFAKQTFKGKTRTVAWAGGKAFEIHIPARPFLVATEKDKEEIGKIFLRHALKGFKA